MNINDFNSLIQSIKPTKKVCAENNKKTPISTTFKDDVFEKNKNQSQNTEIEFTHLCAVTKTPKIIKASLNPLDKGYIYKKVFNKQKGIIQKIPQEVNIAKSTEGINTSYYFLDPKTKTEIGYVIIVDWSKDFFYNDIESPKLLEDFPEQGIEGNRISIDYLQNNDENQYSGIGKLADQIAVEYCLQEGLEPNIVSLADTNSHAAHYKRGRRFFPLNKNDTEINYEDFVKKYKTDDPNKVIEEKIAATPSGEKTDTSDLYGLYMYMPQEVIKKYLEEIKRNPILH